MPGRLLLREIPFADGAQEPDPGEIQATLARARGRSDVVDVRDPSPREVKRWLQRVSSQAHGDLSRRTQRLLERSVKKNS